METMKLIMANPGERQLLEYRRKAEVDRRSMIAFARNEGEIKGRKEGEIKGRKEGREEGELRMAKLITELLKQGCAEDINKAMSDSDYRNILYKQFNIE